MDHAIFALCAINFHYPPEYKENPILQMLNEEEGMDRIGINLISILNTTDGQHTEALLNMFQTIFCNYQTANYFYKNDLKVVIDVILLEGANLPVDSPLRAAYLNVLYQLLMNTTDFFDILYKTDEILELATTLSNDETVCKDARDVAQKNL